MQTHRLKIFFIIWLILSTIPVCPGPVCPAEAAGIRIAVLTSHDAQPYEEVLEGFRQRMASGGREVVLDVHALDGDSTRAAQLLSEIRTESPGLLLTLGSLATWAAGKENPGIPIVAGLVLDMEDLKAGANLTGVCLEFPLETQFQWIQKILPGSRNIGVIYSPGKNLNRVENAVKVAQSLGLKLHTRKVESPSDIPEALEELSRRVDTLWGVADELAFNHQTAKHILLFSFRNRIPLVGLSPEWVKAGAICSLDWDYKDIGMQCGDMALKVLRGSSPGSIPPECPRKVLYSLNLKTASHMKAEVPEAIVQGSHQVFK